MATAGAPGGQVERKEDFGDGKDADIRRWLMEFKLARKGPYKRWLNQYKRIVKRYRDEGGHRSQDDTAQTEDTATDIKSGFNLLWSNVRTMGPAIYSRPPKVIVERRHKDESLVARAACIILQRSIQFQMRLKFDQFHELMKQCRLDFQLGAWCQGKVRYDRRESPPGEGAYGQAADQKGQDPYTTLATPIKRAPADGIQAWPNVASEELCFDLVQPDDFLCSSARTWQEVKWVAFRTCMTREQVLKTKVFGDDARRKHLVENIPFTSKPIGMDSTDAEKTDNGVFMEAHIWAIWDKVDRKILYICEEWADEVIATAADPSSLEDFWPCPPPARGTKTNNTVWPVPDYIEYGAQAREVDELTRRADAVLESIKVAGVYDASIEELKNLLNGGYENQLIGVKMWQELSEKGGLESAMDFLPIDQYGAVLKVLYEARQVAKVDADQMAGVFDVMRGSSDPSETLGAQKLKAGYGEQRSTEPKDELANFARNLLAIAGEMIAEHFSPATLWQQSNFETWWKGQERGLKAKASRGMPPAPGGPPMPAGPMLPPQGAQMPPAGPPAAPGGYPPPAMPQTPVDVGPIAPGAPPGLSGGVPPGAPMPGAPGAPLNGQIIPPGVPGPMPGGMMGPPASPPPPPPPAIPTAEEIFKAAVELLRDEKLRGFVITVETNSTIEPDAAAEQQSRTQLLETLSVYMKQALELGAALPEAVPLIAQTLMFAVRAFPAGRELETVFETFLDRMQQRAENPPPKPPSPEEIKAKSEAAKMQADAEARKQEQQFEIQKMQQELQMARELHQLKVTEMNLELQLTQQKMQLAAVEGQQKLDLQRQKNEMDIKAAADKNAMQERSMVRQDAMEERQAERSEEMEERSMGRQEEHETKMMAAKEKQAAKGGNSAQK